MAGDCGTCTLCCRLLGIAELKKPLNKWCSFCTPGKGCQIYDGRPQSCQDYACIWLQSQEKPGAGLPLELRPDKCKVVMTMPMDQEVIIAHCDPSFPTAWQDGAFGAFCHTATTDGGKKPMRMLVGNGKGHWLVERGRARQVETTEPDENGVQHVAGFKTQGP